eukprot:TRINITY_DN11098_c0_g1_i1.p1 TRINITY_DN11098_c0_g1~~TRINITY_DN11098_c0_g1_i1.p1  ORF type:complete len:192 (-),score=32.99 TRINITY_DN11098_c0_g1_i1:119-694(-)
MSSWYLRLMRIPSKGDSNEQVFTELRNEDEPSTRSPRTAPAPNTGMISCSAGEALRLGGCFLIVAVLVCALCLPFVLLNLNYGGSLYWEDGVCCTRFASPSRYINGIYLASPAGYEGACFRTNMIERTPSGIFTREECEAFCPSIESSCLSDRHDSPIFCEFHPASTTMQTTALPDHYTLLDEGCPVLVSF